MKKNLKNLKLINKKGGCMLRKVLSVLVICCFMFTNVCFAMPSIAGSNPTVDNIALQSAMQEGKNLDSAQMKNITDVFVKASTNADPEVKNYIKETWFNNLVALGKDNANITAEQINQVFEDAGITVSFDKENNTITLSKLAEGKDAVNTITIADGNIVLKGAGFSGKSLPENRGRLVEMLKSAKIKPSQETEAKGEAGMDLARAYMQAAPDTVDAKAKEVLNTGLNNQTLTFADEIAFIDKGNWGAAYTEVFGTIMWKGFTPQATAQVLIYEILRGSNYSPKQALEITEQIVGKSLVADTTKEIEAAVKAAEEAQPKSVKDLELPKSLGDETMKDEDVKSAAMPVIDKSTLPKEQKEAMAEANPKVFATMVRGLIADGIAAIQVKLDTIMDSMHKKYLAQKTVTQDERNLINSALNDGKTRIINDWRDLGYFDDKDNFITHQNKTNYLIEIGVAKIGNRFIVTGAGTADRQASIEKTLAAMRIQGIQVVEGKEDSEAIIRKDGDRLVAIYSQQDAVNGNGERVEYYNITELNNPLVNMMAVIVKVMQRGKDLIGENGAVNIPFEEIKITEEQYEALKADYLEFVNILIQA